MKLYYIEYESTVKFFYNNKSIDVYKSKLEPFLKGLYRKYGNTIKFIDMIA